VTEEDRPLARINVDRSVEVWTRGRHVRFAGNGKRPEVTDAREPPEDAGPLPDDVLREVSSAVTIISFDGWLVRVGDDVVQVVPTRARRSPGRVFSRLPRRGG
jgi:hypothetical protein